MNCRSVKRTLLTAVSFALLYYNVAWAVLRCPHQENHEAQELAAYELGSSHPDVNIDCTGPKYHTEFLAEPSKNSGVIQLARDGAFYGFFIAPDHSEIAID